MMELMKRELEQLSRHVTDMIWTRSEVYKYVVPGGVWRREEDSGERKVREERTKEGRKWEGRKGGERGRKIRKGGGREKGEKGRGEVR